MSLEAIHQAIPHRPPFLFVDEIVELRDDGATGKRLIRADEPQFEGHYPENPIMPGVLLCEACFQVAAYYLSHKLGWDAKGGETGDGGMRTPVLAKIGQARFKQIVRPSDVLTIDVSYADSASGFHMLNGTIKNQDGKLCLRVEFTLAMVEEKA